MSLTEEGRSKAEQILKNKEIVFDKHTCKGSLGGKGGSIIIAYGFVDIQDVLDDIGAFDTEGILK